MDKEVSSILLTSVIWRAILELCVQLKGHIGAMCSTEGPLELCVQLKGHIGAVFNWRAILELCVQLKGHIGAMCSIEGPLELCVQLKGHWSYVFNDVIWEQGQSIMSNTIFVSSLWGKQYWLYNITLFRRLFLLRERTDVRQGITSCQKH